MPLVSSIFLVISLFLAVMVGPQTRPWSWGPAMLALGFAVAATFPGWWKRDRTPTDFGTIFFGVLVAIWFAMRAWMSPVAELGQADLLLLTVAIGAFISIKSIAGNLAAERILIWGIALLLLANIIAVGIQLTDPSFSPIFREKAVPYAISGFFAEYSEAANFFIFASILVAAAALFGRHAIASRVILAALAIAGFACVWFTHSRGGTIGAATGLGVFAAAVLMTGKKRGARWFAPALIAIPVIGLGVGAFLIMGWQNAQEARAGNSNITQIFDNTSRLYMLGMALSCFNLHPLMGGGSRSFSWECFQFANGKDQGDIITHKPEFVHNDIAQTFTDFGLIGGVLLIAFFSTLVISSIVKILFEDEHSSSHDNRDAWRIGALAGFSGMLVQSCFNFVFHLIPGILFLGICLGQMTCGTPIKDKIVRRIVSRALLTLVLIVCCILLIPMGWKGLQVTNILWPTYFSKHPLTSVEPKIDALTHAIQIWPQAEFYQQRAAAYQILASEPTEKPDISLMEAALADYQNASQLFRFDPGVVLSRANVLSRLVRDHEAEDAYARGIALQGGMEPAFRGHFALANHFLKKGLREFKPDASELALKSLELAAQEIEDAVNEMHWLNAEIRELRLSIYESLGAVRDASGNRQGALQIYQKAIKLPEGNRVHYRLGLLIGNMASDTWAARKPSEAMRDFIQARAHIAATNTLPQGVSASQRTAYLAYLDHAIAFLKGAKITPAAEDHK